MSHKILASIVLILFLLTACASPAPTPTPTLVLPTATAIPNATATALPTATAAAIPTANTIPLTQTTIVDYDLTGVTLALSDLPPGFYLAEDGNLKSYNVSEDDLRKEFSQSSRSRQQNFYGFMKGNLLHYDMVAGILLKGLSESEQMDFDKTLDQVNKNLSPVNPARGTSLMTGLDKFGDKSIGVLASTTIATYPLHWERVYIRKGPVVLVMYYAYDVKGPTPIQSLELARLLDSRLAKALATK